MDPLFHNVTYRRKKVYELRVVTVSLTLWYSWFCHPGFLIRLFLFRFRSSQLPELSHMSLRTHLDRYCMQRAMAPDLISSSTRSRSTTRAPSSSAGPSPFHRPPGWQPSTSAPHRPVIVKIDLEPMQQLAATTASRRQPFHQ